MDRVAKTKKNAVRKHARPLTGSGKALAVLMLLALSVFSVSALRAIYRPHRMFASADATPPTVRSTAKFPAEDVASDAQPAGVSRRARLAQEAAASSPSPVPHVVGRPLPPRLQPRNRPVAMVHPPPPRPSAVPNARAAIIIDDCGNNNEPTQMFVDSSAPVTLSILPYLAFSKIISKAAKEKGKGVMLHFPMEASGGQDPGPGTLRVAMSDEQKQKIINDNLDSVPNLQGVNNHEGSLATKDVHSMDMVLKAVQRKKLFFIDSYTTPNSCLRDVASHIGIPFARRDLFLDNVDEIEPIKEQMRALIKEALAHGQAIGIGHARTTTATAFVEMIPAFEEAGVKLVLVGELTHVVTPEEAHPINQKILRPRVPQSPVRPTRGVIR